MYNPAAWYWVVGGRIYSSARGFITPGDKTFSDWLAGGNLPSRINSEAELADVLNAPVDAEIERIELGTLRALRELSNGCPSGRLAEADKRVAALRAKRVKFP